MNNKNPETDIGVQPQDQRSKAAKPLESSYCSEITRLKEKPVPVSAILTFLSSVGIKGVHYHRLASG